MLSGRVYQCRPHAGARYYKIQLPKGLEPGTPFSITIVATAMYLRFTHAISYQRLTRLLLDPFGLSISEGALDVAFRRGKPSLDAEVAADWIATVHAPSLAAGARPSIPGRSVFVYIDDNEGSDLKLLMDQVFGRGLFVTDRPDVMSDSGD